MFLITLAVAVLFFYGMVRFLEKTALFFPARDIIATPRDAGLAFEDVTFTAEDGVRLHGWLMPNPAARRNLIYFHGNAGNISNRVEKMAFYYTLGFNIFIFDYRGYGRSEGHPSEAGVYKDGRAAFDYLASRPDVGRWPVVLYGASVGGAVAIDVATARRPAALVVEATFTNARDMALIYYPYVPGFMLSLKLDSAKKVAGITCPKLMLHSPTDEVVPYSLGRRLFEAAREPKEFLEVRGGHNDNIFQSEDIVKPGLERFLAEHGI